MRKIIAALLASLAPFASHAEASPLEVSVGRAWKRVLQDDPSRRGLRFLNTSATANITICPVLISDGKALPRCELGKVVLGPKQESVAIGVTANARVPSGYDARADRRSARLLIEVVK
jgi:hypothetical protein